MLNRYALMLQRIDQRMDLMGYEYNCAEKEGVRGFACRLQVPWIHLSPQAKIR